MRDFDRKASGCLWGFFVVLGVGLSTPFAVLAFVTRKRDERVVSAIMALGLGPLAMLIGLAAMALVLSRHKDERILAMLADLQPRLFSGRGTIVKPTLGRPLIQPRLITESPGGREIEVRCVPMSRQQAALNGGSWHVIVLVEAPAEFRFGILTKRRFVTFRASIAGMNVADLGTPGWDEDVVVASDDVPRALGVLRDSAVLAHCTRIFQANRAPSKLQLSPATPLSPLGAVYEAVLLETTDERALGDIVEGMVALADRLRELGVAR